MELIQTPPPKKIMTFKQFCKHQEELKRHQASLGKSKKQPTVSKNDSGEIS
jgi:hypothetical protein